MRAEERFERIDHITAGWVEERRKDREDRQLWRDTQRQINEIGLRINDLTVKIADTNDAITRLAEESRAEDRRLGERIEDVDRRLGERIDSLVSVIGEFLSKQKS